MASRADTLRNLKSRDTVYPEDFEAVLDFIGHRGQGALVFGSAFQSIATGGVGIDVTDWDTVVYDDLGFFDLASPGVFTIPETDPVIQRIQIYYQYSWQPNADGTRNFFLKHSGFGNVRGGIAENGIPPQAAAPLAQTAYSMPINTVPGDTWSIAATQDSGIALLLGLLGFGITVMN